MEKQVQLLNQSKSELAKRIPSNSEESWLVRSKFDIPANVSLAEIRQLDPFQTSSLVRKENGVADKSECYKFIQVAIVGITQFFGSHLTDYQLLEVSKILYQKFWYWRLLDWKNFKERVCGLSYGKDHGKVYSFVNTAHILEWANAYDADWTGSAESETQHDHDQLKKVSEQERSLSIEIEAGKEADFHNKQVQDFKEKTLKQYDTKPAEENIV